MSQKYEDIFNTTIYILYIYIHTYIWTKQILMFTFLKTLDLQGNYKHLINVGLFFRFVSSTVVPNMSFFTHMLHIYK